MIDYHVQFIRFPTNKIRESVVENEDGSYTIFIEVSLNHEMQLKAFKHAMIHILGNDFTKDDINKIELQAHTAQQHYL